ncbi:hypothetical protein ScPMuIL_003010 [Solemya velum]
MKFKTIREGEQAVIFNHMGEGTLMIGPKRVFLFRKRLNKLEHVMASQYQYIVVKDKEGVVSHKPGPCELFFNPLMYDRVHVQEAIKIDANHMIVVYRSLKKGEVQRRIIQGPAVFVPEAEEWLHNFKWHGPDPTSLGRMIPNHSEFDQLAAIPDQFYYNVREVRTNDDTMITVKLMIFYVIVDILKMLDTTHDPIADLINAVCSDVIEFAGKISYEEFLQKTNQLGEISQYPQLLQRAERIGYTVQKVVYRGYIATNQLQLMQNSAIESRTQLRLNAEIESQKQKLADFKLEKEQERTQMRQGMERNKLEHKQKLQALQQEHVLETKELEHSQKLEIAALMTQTQLEIKTSENEQKLRHLQDLKNLSVDLTQVLTSQQEAPVAEEIQVMEL